MPTMRRRAGRRRVPSFATPLPPSAGPKGSRNCGSRWVRTQRRTLQEDAFARVIPGLPDGDYALLRFRTLFSGKPDAEESLTLERDPDRCVAGGRLRHSVSAAPILIAMSETAAISNSPAPRAAAQAVWNPAKQKLICPFCGTESPAKLDVDDRRRRRARPGRGVARHQRRRARLEGRRSARSNARVATRFRCSIRRGRRRTANSAARRNSFPTRKPSRHSGPRACCHSPSAKARRAIASGSGTAGCGWRRAR